MTHEVTRADSEMVLQIVQLAKAASEGGAINSLTDMLHLAAAHRSTHEAPLLAENERLRARLEVVTGWSESADGISCRDDTIALQDARIEKLLARIAELEAAQMETLMLANKTVPTAFKERNP